MEYTTKEEFRNLEKRVRAIEEGINNGVARSVKERPESLAEFLHQKNLKNNTDKTICIVYFLEGRKDEGITSEDVADGFRESRHTVPSNASDQLARCARKGFIQEGGKRDGKKVWVLTNTGVKYVEGLGEHKTNSIWQNNILKR